MRKHLIKISFIILFVSFVSGYALCIKMAGDYWFLLVTVVLFLLGALSLFYITQRVVLFRNKFVAIVRKLIAGNYEVDIEQSRVFTDEVNFLTQLFSKFLSQLRVYDVLRNERISLVSRALDLFYNSVDEGVVMVNVEKETVRCNPKVRALFNIDQETFTFTSLRLQKRNRRLIRLCIDAIIRKKIVQEGDVTVRLPVGEKEQTVHVKIFPLKGKDEKVKMAFVFITPIAGG